MPFMFVTVNCSVHIALRLRCIVDPRICTLSKKIHACRCQNYSGASVKNSGSVVQA